MIERLLEKDVQDFIYSHEHDDEQELLLRHKTLFDLPVSLIAWQIAGRRKAKTKLPLYYNTPGIIYPPGLNLEQSSSERTAVFKATLLNSLPISKESIVDLTGGFGVDSLFFSKIFNTVKYIEPNAELLSYAKHNHQLLGSENVQHYNTTAEAYLASTMETASCIFIDPSRRKNLTQKVFKFSDCEPDVIELLPEIFKSSSYLLIKTSPLVDLQQGIKELGSVKKIWVVSVNNDCKELLFLCEKGFTHEPEITTINLSDHSEEFSFHLSEEQQTISTFSEPLTYLYEPNASILKAGAFKLIAEKFSLFKLHPSTHLYTSTQFVADFPGRIFLINQVLKSDQKSVKAILPEGKANVLTRNYPLSPDALKKKLKVKDGGDTYLIGFSGQTQKFLVAAARLK